MFKNSAIYVIIQLLRTTRRTLQRKNDAMRIQMVSRLVESAASEIIGDDDVSDGVEHELNIGCIDTHRHMAINLLQ